MKVKLLLVLLILLTGLSAQGQDFKIGYANIDAIVYSMPSMDAIRVELEDYQQLLTRLINERSDNIKTKMQVLQRLAQDPDSDELMLKNRQNEIINLQEELQALSSNSEIAYDNKKIALTNPVYTMVQNAIEEVRKELGYTMILNTQTGTGSGIVLAAREEDNITEAVFKKLGVPMPPIE